ncbi:MAG: signal peptidase I [Cellulomonadaceae bacterium]|jgi:signal peptidase|nr:signal peptidase I [Cellulomonadaceae bacterium]
MSHQKRKRKHGNLGRILSNVIIALILLIVATVALVPRLLGAEPLTVLTGSMQPALRPGDIVVVQPTAVENLSVGDIITFQQISGDPTLTTHRIVNIVRDGNAVIEVVTRGDANNTDDAPLIPEQIVGRVVYSIPLLGYLTDGPTAVLAIALLIGIALVAYAVTAAVKTVRANRRDGQAKAL